VTVRNCGASGLPSSWVNTQPLQQRRPLRGGALPTATARRTTTVSGSKPRRNRPRLPSTCRGRSMLKYQLPWPASQLQARHAPPAAAPSLHPHRAYTGPEPHPSNQSRPFRTLQPTGHDQAAGCLHDHLRDLSGCTGRRARRAGPGRDRRPRRGWRAVEGKPARRCGGHGVAHRWQGRRAAALRGCRRLRLRG
jgi:hypothetical protein